jgi:hypothetical protein
VLLANPRGIATARAKPAIEWPTTHFAAGIRS